ncbi:MAG: hypothetical protein ACYDG5_01370 [Dehalococcoidales bacterium]
MNRATLLFEDPREQENLKQFFLVWCADLLERMVRLRQYVSERLASIPAGSPEPDILDSLLRENNNVVEMLQSTAKDLITHDATQVSRDWLSYFSTLRLDIPNAFRKLHSRLSFIPAPWPRPELELFVRSVLELACYEGGLSRKKQGRWTLLLTGDFNFSDILATDISSREQKYGLSDTGKHLFGDIPSPIRLALTMPAVERDNPIAWLNLIHELGHLIGEIDGIVEKARSIPSVKNYQNGDPVDYIRIHDNWIPEIVADLIATDLLGVGYYASFVEFATFWAEDSARIPIGMHPPVDARCRYIFNRLSELGEINSTFRDELEVEYKIRSLLDYQSDMIRPNIQDEQANGHVWETELVEISQEIVSLDEYKAILKNPRNTVNIDFLNDLANQLRKHWLISSQPTNLRQLSANEIEADLKQCKQDLVHTENDMRNIVTAASLVKREQTRINGSKLIYPFIDTPPKKIKSYLIDLWSEIHKLDIIVAKSVEAAEILKFYQASSTYQEMVKQWMES